MSADLVDAQNKALAEMKASQIATLQFQSKMTTQNNMFNSAIEASKAAKNASNKLQG